MIETGSGIRDGRVSAFEISFSPNAKNRWGTLFMRAGASADELDDRAGTFSVRGVLVVASTRRHSDLPFGGGSRSSECVADGRSALRAEIDLSVAVSERSITN